MDTAVDRSEHWVSLKEASTYLGIAKEGVRKRVKRGTIQAKLEDGIWLVNIAGVDVGTAEAAATEVPPGSTQPADLGAPTAVDSLELEGFRILVHSQAQEIAFLRDQLQQLTHQRERDQSIIAALTQRVPQLSAAT